MTPEKIIELICDADWRAQRRAEGATFQGVGTLQDYVDLYAATKKAATDGNRKAAPARIDFIDSIPRGARCVETK